MLSHSLKSHDMAMRRLSILLLLSIAVPFAENEGKRDEECLFRESFKNNK